MGSSSSSSCRTWLALSPTSCCCCCWTTILSSPLPARGFCCQSLSLVEGLRGQEVAASVLGCCRHVLGQQGQVQLPVVTVIQGKVLTTTSSSSSRRGPKRRHPLALLFQVNQHVASATRVIYRVIQIIKHDEVLLGRWRQVNLPWLLLLLLLRHSTRSPLHSLHGSVLYGPTTGRSRGGGGRRMEFSDVITCLGTGPQTRYKAHSWQLIRPACGHPCRPMMSLDTTMLPACLRECP